MITITQTPRTIIRQFEPQEKDMFIELMTDTRVNAQLPQRTVEQIAGVFTDTIADYLQDNKLTRWGIFDAFNGDFIGLSLLKGNPDDPGRAELGYVLHLKYQGKGLATEMAKALVAYGFDTMHLNEIIAVTTHPNIVSQKVLFNAGFKQGDHIIRTDNEVSFFSIAYQDYRDMVA